jgi:ribosomal protein S21
MSKSKNLHAKVVPKKGEPFERMVKRFLKKVKKERVIEQVKDRRYYEKPSVTKKKEKLAGIARWKKFEADKRKKELAKEANYNKRVDNNKRRED